MKTDGVIKALILAAAILVAPLLSSCDNESGSGTVGRKAILIVYFEPNPVAIDYSGRWRYTVVVGEINGVGVNIYGWNIEWYSDAGVNTQSGTGTDIEFAAQFLICGGEGTYIPGGGMRCGPYYIDKDEVANAGYLVYTFYGVDDNGNEVEGTGRLDLQ